MTRRWASVRRIARALPAAAVLFVTAAAIAHAQFFGGRGGETVVRGMPDVPNGFVFCRLMYTAVRSDPSGTGWDIEYPRADQNLLHRLSQLSLTPMSMWKNGRPGHTVVRATDPEIFNCPFLSMASPASVGFSEAEAAALRQYLLKGGFLWADDFWGEASWSFWVQEIKKVLPEYEIFDLTPGHPLFTTYYNIDAVPQIPSLNRWRPGMSTSEMGAESETPHMRGIADDKGNLMVLITHNTDIADGWEREADLEAFFVLFSAKAYAVGINVAIWSMTR